MSNPLRLALLLLLVVVPVETARAVEIDGIKMVSLDQPRINVVVRRSATGDPIVVTDPLFGDIFNVQAFYDSGASGILLSNATADTLGIVRDTFGGEDIIFEDVGVGGATEFNVSEVLYFSLANFHPNVDVETVATIDLYYTYTTGPVRAQVGPLPEDPFPLLGGLDVFGMPTIAGKYVVMDPTPLNPLALTGDIFLVDTMRTYIYDPGTPYNHGLRNSNPGIPVTSRHIQMSNADFDRFTSVSPAGAPGPTLAENPFIGPDPVGLLEGDTSDTTPGIKIGQDGLFSEGSWLFDMGAAASILSQAQAAAVGVTYSTDPLHELGSDDPQLVGVPLEEQFALTIGGIGGSVKVAGFRLDSALIRANEGDVADDDDPMHIKYLNFPVLVFDITVQDPITAETITLDGILGMNSLVASAEFDEEDPFSAFENMAPGAFRWSVFDTIDNTLGLHFDQTIVPFATGDLTQDFEINAADIDFLAANLGNPAFDVDGDGDADQDDLDFLVGTILGTTYGDSNLDGAVDGADFNDWRGGTAGWADGDWNSDGAVDGADFNIWRTAEPLAPISVPEPAAAAMLALVAVCSLLLRPPKRALTLPRGC